MTTAPGMETTRLAVSAYPVRLRVWMLILNLFPLAHVSMMVAIAVANLPVWVRLTGVLVSLLILPPLLARLVHALSPVRSGRIAVETPGFLAWWATAQFQMIFNRLPVIEELMRIVPGLYSNWLRLWGSRIGRLTFWSPGMVVLDREYLDLGDDVVFGAGVRLNGHVILRNRHGRLELALAPIKIGSGASIGGYSLITAGTEIAPGESTRAHLLSPPFTVWRDGKRWKGVDDESF
ncbi:MAG: hypothetical protein LAO55_23785 [Acidobacteriia bacterium]|nr:hypothetical protein [Terriglobia bacterium]